MVENKGEKSEKRNKENINDSKPNNYQEGKGKEISSKSKSDE